MAKAQPPDQLADSAFVIRHMPARQDQLLQVDAAPAHHPITLAIGADFDQGGKLGFRSGRQPA